MGCFEGSGQVTFFFRLFRHVLLRGSTLQIRFIVDLNAPAGQGRLPQIRGSFNSPKEDVEMKRCGADPTLIATPISLRTQHFLKCVSEHFGFHRNHLGISLSPDRPLPSRDAAGQGLILHLKSTMNPKFNFKFKLFKF